MYYGRMEFEPDLSDPHNQIAYCLEALDVRLTELERLLHAALDYMPDEITGRLKASSEAAASAKATLALHDLIDQVLDLKDSVGKQHTQEANARLDDAETVEQTYGDLPAIARD